MALIGCGTFIGLKHFESKKIKQVVNGKGRK